MHPFLHPKWKVIYPRSQPPPPPKPPFKNKPLLGALCLLLFALTGFCTEESPQLLRVMESLGASVGLGWFVSLIFDL